MPPQLKGVLAYAFMPLSSIVMYFVEPKNKFIRFHSVQAFAVGVALLILNRLLGAIFGAIPYTPGISSVFGLIQVLVGLGSLALWVMLMMAAYRGQEWKLPVLGDMAADFANKGM
jgi:uncharacterized membrane protein